jgi:hypothetical protein
MENPEKNQGKLLYKLFMGLLLVILATYVGYEFGKFLAH